MRLLIAGGLCAVLAGLASAPVRAQEIPRNDCDEFGTYRHTGASEITSCLRQASNTRSLITVSQAIQRIVGGRLIAGPALAEPAGLLLESDADIAERLKSSGTIAVDPAADVTAAPLVIRKWNVWGDGKYSRIVADDHETTAEGPLVNLTGGIDYKLTDRVIFGVMGSYENSDLDTSGLFPISLQTDGYGGGAYVGITLTSNVVFSGLVTYSAIDTDLDTGFATSDTDSERLQASGGLTGYWYFGQTRLSPSFTVAWSKEWQDSFTDSGGGFNPDQTFETVVLTGGDVLGHTFSFDGGMSIEPFVGTFIDWTVYNNIKTDGFGDFDQPHFADLRLQTGFNLNIASNVQLAVTGEVSGLLLDDTNTYAGEANLAVQF
ncbi:hypothetical protein BH10PSE7_BH10PSE7_07130 [soil metagenome]